MLKSKSECVVDVDFWRAPGCIGLKSILRKESFKMDRKIVEAGQKKPQNITANRGKAV
jgi:hypothetical protein